MNQVLIDCNELIKRQDFNKALPKLRKFNQQNKNRTGDSLNMEALCLTALGREEKALEVLHKALLLKLNDEKKHLVISNTVSLLLKQNDSEKIKSILASYITEQNAVKYAKLCSHLCLACVHLKDYVTIEKLAPKLKNLNDYHIAAKQYLTESAIASGDKDKAISLLEDMALYTHLMKEHETRYVIEHLIRVNQYAKANSLLGKVASKYNNLPWFKLLKSELLTIDKNCQGVQELLKDEVDALTDTTFTEQSRIMTKILADAYQLDKQYEQAFKYYQKLGQINRVLYKDFKPRNFIKEYGKLDLTALPQTSNDEVFNPVFMYGFPRSGTTLLETILDTQPKILTMSEQDTTFPLIELVNEITKGKQKYPHSLAKLNQGNITALQEKYYQLATSYLGQEQNIVEQTGITVIDKLPLKSVHLPLVCLLFPNAKHIINIRHPLDSILSNTQQCFSMNNEMAFLMDLDSCVERYIEVFSNLEKLEQDYQLDTIYIRYEDLISDLDGECAKLFDFLGVKAEGEFAKFYEHAKTKTINTASKHQVVQPLYNTSKYKWLNYREQLAPYLPKLEYFINKFGYNN